MNRLVKIALIVVLFFALILLRGFYRDFLYDPLNEYFSSNYLNEGFPNVDKLQYFKTISIRFLLNTGISILIIFLFFRNKNVVILALKVYLVAFVLLNLMLFLELKFNYSNSYLVLFYIRRFLIHPLLLLILLPAFYYQLLMKK